MEILLDKEFYTGEEISEMCIKSDINFKNGCSKDITIEVEQPIKVYKPCRFSANNGNNIEFNIEKLRSSGYSGDIFINKE